MYIDQDELFEKTNGGLDIVLSYYPQAKDVIEGKAKAFRIRTNEKTPSASLKKKNDGHWLVTDWEGDQVSRNGVQVCQHEEGISYGEALAKLATQYGVGGISKEINRATFEKRSAKADELDGETYFDYNEEISEDDLKVLGPKVTKEVCKSYHVISLKSFTSVKNRVAYVTGATETYPIFLIDCTEFKKIYQPLNPDKQFRFRYVGKKPKDFIYGLAQLQAAYKKYQEQQMKDSSEDDEDKDINKLPEAIMVSGERDALNVAGFGYQVIWRNSETAPLKERQYRDIMKCVDRLYNLPDIDHTGIREGCRLGLTHMDIHTIWLPGKLKTYKDRRGNPRKDLLDYVEIWQSQKDFNKLVYNAIPMRFWDEQIKDKQLKYSFNNAQAYHFLWANGFHKIENKNLKDGYAFVQVKGNVVEEVIPQDVKGFVNNWLEDNYKPVGLRNMIYKTTQLSEASLGNLKKVKIDFTDFDKKRQFLFFKNCTWEVTASGVKEHKHGAIDRYVWGEEVIDHKVKRIEPAFEVTRDKETGEYDIKINHLNSLFLRYLINVSRVHWRRELEGSFGPQEEKEREAYYQANRWNIAGDKLDEDEQWEQKQHLINKIFSLGYLLHRYKDPARPWCVYAMDNRISEQGKSYGRSGKSVCYKAPRHFMKSVMLPGRNPKLTDNPHIYDRVTEHTDYVLIDDADLYLNFNFFFEPLTGPLIVNPKNNQSYEIPFEHVPKFCITTNFTPRNIDPSTEGRLLYTVFSDFYHVCTDDTDYLENRTINDDIGKNLFFDYDEYEWNHDINFFAECLQFYLNVPSPVKLSPPLGNVRKRNLLTEMTDAFKRWADVFFSPEGGKADELVSKTKALENFKIASSMHKWTMQKFTSSMKAWAKYTDWVIELDPDEFKNKQGRIIRKHDGEATEMIFVRTKATIAAEQRTEENNYEPKEEPEKVAENDLLSEDDREYLNKVFGFLQRMEPGTTIQLKHIVKPENTLRFICFVKAYMDTVSYCDVVFTEDYLRIKKYER